MEHGGQTTGEVLMAGGIGRLAPPMGVRTRLTAAAVLVVFVAMALGGSGLIWLLEDNLETAAAGAAAARAAAVSDVITSIGLSEAAATMVADPGNGELVQIL